MLQVPCLALSFKKAQAKSKKTSKPELPETCFVGFIKFCGPRVVSEETSREVLRDTKSIFLCFVRSPPKIPAKTTLKYVEDLFFLSSLEFPLIFTSNLSRNDFLVLASTDCVACSKSPLPVPQKVWPPLLYTVCNIIGSHILHYFRHSRLDQTLQNTYFSLTILCLLTTLVQY